MLTQERLKELLHYDPETGVFTWIHNLGRKAKKDGIAGTVMKSGYIRIKIDGIDYLAHRLAWLYTHGENPTKEIDHIDRSKNNNSIKNLRDVSKNWNQQNRVKFTQNNITKCLGVTPNGSGFSAKISIDGKQKYLGTFKTVSDARLAYDNAKKTHHLGAFI